LTVLGPNAKPAMRTSGRAPANDGGGAARGAQRGQRDDEVLLLVRLVTLEAAL